MNLQDITIQPITRSDHVEYALLCLPEQSASQQPIGAIFVSPWTAELLAKQIKEALKGKTIDVLALSRARLDTQNVLKKKPADAETVRLLRSAQAALTVELETVKKYRMSEWVVNVFVAEVPEEMNTPSRVPLIGSTQDLYNFSADLSEAFRSDDRQHN